MTFCAARLLPAMVYLVLLRSSRFLERLEPDFFPREVQIRLGECGDLFFADGFDVMVLIPVEVVSKLQDGIHEYNMDIWIDDFLMVEMDLRDCKEDWKGVKGEGYEGIICILVQAYRIMSSRCLEMMRRS